MKRQDQDMDSQDVLKMLQQKIGNVELTVHALMSALEKEGLLEDGQVNEEAKEIVEEMKEVAHPEKEVEQRLED